MKIAYVDETGTDGKSPVLVMVGVLADTSRVGRTRTGGALAKEPGTHGRVHLHHPEGSAALCDCHVDSILRAEMKNLRPNTRQRSDGTTEIAVADLVPTGMLDPKLRPADCPH